ncbi:SCO3374 family protein [Streptomyces sp. Isolate_219]|uniref:SCO3374 family protein n=1 Tax=Streptomyces sp. Isolate_219 TaxID=2950110 RepID=UPI0021C6EC78|nr:SCO3374 family protein [Streptomyces sp. Isolate_219]MCR8575642.1 SCO3374 family protein [Streptomyces sp. Isolate_219]
MARVLPRPRIPLAAVRRWYEEELGWPATGTEPVELLTGLRFDVLEMPPGAGSAVLRRLPHTGPVALLRAGCDGNHAGDRPKLLMLIAAGGAEELPGILEWLEWGALVPDLTARGTGDRMPAPAFPTGAAPSYGFGSREAARWVRPPRPGYEVENSLPTTGMGAGNGDDGDAPDLVRLVSAAATECHRARLMRAGNAQSDRAWGDQPLAFSNASRMSAGTRPRSLTL